VRRPQFVSCPAFLDELPLLLRHTGKRNILAVGLRRSYGDSCLNSEGVTIDTTRLNRFQAFDKINGTLRAEAGVSLSEILALTVPHGWFLPTVPGTRFVTLGGAIANDVHGKNHQRAGSFGRYVRLIGLRRSDGEFITLTPESHPQLFRATIGGLGLTGVIEFAELKLSRISGSSLEVEVIPYQNFEEFWPLAHESAATHEHTVAWVDCLSADEKLGRGLFFRANWTAGEGFEVHSDHTAMTVPFELPSFLLNRATVGALNTIYHGLARMRSRRYREHYSHHFYRLDPLRNWNRLYGKAGTFQYQCVVPSQSARDAMRDMLALIQRSGNASSLAVMKTFGALQSPGLLSFAREGTTLALDLPNRGAETISLMADLDAIVSEAAGALYPAKDGRITRKLFQCSFPNLEEFAKHKDPGISSDFWRRIMKE
jgi:FAD/FMN-containing dehydrogenase